MRATVYRVWDALCAGRAPGEIATRFTVALGIAALLWLFACAFLIVEPVA